MEPEDFIDEVIDELQTLSPDARGVFPQRNRGFFIFSQGEREIAQIVVDGDMVSVHGMPPMPGESNWPSKSYQYDDHTARRVAIDLLNWSDHLRRR